MRKQKSPKELGFTAHDITRLSKAMQAVADKRTAVASSLPAQTNLDDTEQSR